MLFQLNFGHKDELYKCNNFQDTLTPGCYIYSPLGNTRNSLRAFPYILTVHSCNYKPLVTTFLFLECVCVWEREWEYAWAFVNCVECGLGEEFYFTLTIWLFGCFRHLMMTTCRSFTLGQHDIYIHTNDVLEFRKSDEAWKLHSTFCSTFTINFLCCKISCSQGTKDKNKVLIFRLFTSQVLFAIYYRPTSNTNDAREYRTRHEVWILTLQMKSLFTFVVHSAMR